MIDPSGSRPIFRKQRYVALAVVLLALLACGPFGTPTPTLRPPPPTSTPKSAQPAAPVGGAAPGTQPTTPPSGGQPAVPTEGGGVASPAPTSSSPAEPPVVQSFAVCYEDACLGSTIDYLIVTRPLFIEALTPFINWKTDQGYRVGVVTVEWLAGAYSGRHLAEQMKTGMHDLRRKAAGGGTLYVLLVGDTEVKIADFSIQALMESYNLSIEWNVPTGFYRRIYNDPPETILPSDAYFVEDRDWDPDNTGLNPVPDQAQGQGRFDATLYLGRWSVRDPGEIGPIFEKTRNALPADRILFATDEEFTGSGYCTSWPPTGYSGPNSYASCYVNSEIVESRLFGGNATEIYLETWPVAVPAGERVVCYDEMGVGDNWFCLSAVNSVGSVFEDKLIRAEPPAQTTISAPYVPAKSGSVSSDGRDLPFVSPGDDGSDFVYEGFMTFDIRGLSGNAAIVSAYLNLGPCSVKGHPGTDLGQLSVVNLQYGDLNATDYQAGGAYIAAVDPCTVFSIDVTSRVEAMKAEVYFQVRLYFSASDFDGEIDDVTYTSPTLDITYVILP